MPRIPDTRSREVASVTRRENESKRRKGRRERAGGRKRKPTTAARYRHFVHEECVKLLISPRKRRGSRLPARALYNQKVESGVMPITYSRNHLPSLGQGEVATKFPREISKNPSLVTSVEEDALEALWRGTSRSEREEEGEKEKLLNAQINSQRRTDGEPYDKLKRKSLLNKLKVVERSESRKDLTCLNDN
ncbi:hypothetical protein ALC60_10842 [Trachymyrmex zeteki]|uniref:Uncharacterized protein n=1 Tax=Mycetomoellerius zeteki TaxID=64791 RepID=A0A151WQH5_9HYME|nr:hypothetical protein ALC60_10842 [Trachymyrmex zeteki]